MYHTYLDKPQAALQRLSKLRFWWANTFSDCKWFLKNEQNQIKCKSFAVHKMFWIRCKSIVLSQKMVFFSHDLRGGKTATRFIKFLIQSNDITSTFRWLWKCLALFDLQNKTKTFSTTGCYTVISLWNVNTQINSIGIYEFWDKTCI